MSGFVSARSKADASGDRASGGARDAAAVTSAQASFDPELERRVLRAAAMAKVPTSQTEIAMVLGEMFDKDLNYYDVSQVVKYIKKSKDMEDADEPADAPAPATVVPVKAHAADTSKVPVDARASKQASKAAATPATSRPAVAGASSSSAAAPVSDDDDVGAKLCQVAGMPIQPSVFAGLCAWRERASASEESLLLSSGAVRQLVSSFVTSRAPSSMDKHLEAVLTGAVAEGAVRKDGLPASTASKAASDRLGPAAPQAVASTFVAAVRKVVTALVAMDTAAAAEEEEEEDAHEDGTTGAAASSAEAHGKDVAIAAGLAVETALVGHRSRTTGLGKAAAAAAAAAATAETAAVPTAAGSTAADARDVRQLFQAYVGAHDGFQSIATAAASIAAVAGTGSSSGGDATSDEAAAKATSAAAAKALTGLSKATGAGSSVSSEDEAKVQTELAATVEALQSEVAPSEKRFAEATSRLSSLQTRKAELAAQLAEVERGIAAAKASRRSAQEEKDSIGERYRGRVEALGRKRKGLLFGVRRSEVAAAVTTLCRDTPDAVLTTVRSAVGAANTGMVTQAKRLAGKSVTSLRGVLISAARLIGAVGARAASDTRSADLMQEELAEFARLGPSVALLRESTAASVRDARARAASDKQTMLQLRAAVAGAVRTVSSALPSGVLPTPQETGAARACAAMARGLGVPAGQCARLTRAAGATDADIEADAASFMAKIRADLTPTITRTQPAAAPEVNAKVESKEHEVHAAAAASGSDDDDEDVDARPPVAIAPAPPAASAGATTVPSSASTGSSASGKMWGGWGSRSAAPASGSLSTIMATQQTTRKSAAGRSSSNSVSAAAAAASSGGGKSVIAAIVGSSN